MARPFESVALGAVASGGLTVRGRGGSIGVSVAMNIQAAKRGGFCARSRLLAPLILGLVGPGAFGAEDQFVPFGAGDLLLTVRQSAQGAAVQGLSDAKSSRQLLATASQP